MVRIRSFVQDLRDAWDALPYVVRAAIVRFLRTTLGAAVAGVLLVDPTANPAGYPRALLAALIAGLALGLDKARRELRREWEAREAADLEPLPDANRLPSGTTFAAGYASGVRDGAKSFRYGEVHSFPNEDEALDVSHRLDRSCPCGPTRTGEMGTVLEYAHRAMDRGNPEAKS